MALWAIQSKIRLLLHIVEILNSHMQLEVIDIYGIGVFGHQKNDKTIDVYGRRLSFSNAFSA
jgi:hypothetical protein